MQEEIFFIQLSPEKVVYSTYWPADEDYYANGEQYTPAVKENVAITKEQWADVEQIVLELYPQLEEIPEKREIIITSHCPAFMCWMAETKAT